MFKKYILYCLLIPFFLSCTKSKERQLDVQKQTQELDLIDKEENSDSIHYVETSRLAKRLLLLGNAYYYKQNNLVRGDFKLTFTLKTLFTNPVINVSVLNVVKLI